MESLVQSFESLTVAEHKVWDDPRSKEQRSLQDAKVQLDATVASTELFYSELMESNETKVARALSHLVRQGDPRKSTLLLQSTVDDLPEAWDGLVADLENSGLDKETSAEYRSYVSTWVQRAQNDGRLASVPEGIQSQGVSSPENESEVQKPERKKTMVSRKPLPSFAATGEMEQSSERQVDIPIVVVQTQEEQSMIPHSASRISSVDELSSTFAYFGERRTVPPNDNSRGPTPSSASSPLQVWSVVSAEKEISPGSDTSGIDSDDDLYYSPKRSIAKAATHARSKSTPSMSQIADHSSLEPISLKMEPFSDSNSSINKFNDAADPYPPENHNSTQTIVPGTVEEKIVSLAHVSSEKMLKENSPVSASPEQIAGETALLKTVSSSSFSTAPERVMSPDPYSAPIPLDSSSTGSSPRRAPPPVPLKRPPPPPVPPKVSSPDRQAETLPTSPTLQSGLFVNTVQTQEDILRQMEEDPPSPIQEEFDLIGNAKCIVEAWNEHSWVMACELLEKQIEAVANGTYMLHENGEPAQPNLKFLRHLQGVSCSLAGNFNEAELIFKKILKRTHFEPPDAITVAAARWLGDNCIVTNRAWNAAMAWSVGLFAAVPLAGIHDPYTYTLMDDLKYLNQLTSSSSLLKTRLSLQGKDLTSVFNDAPREWKSAVLIRTQEYIRQGNLVPRPPTQDLIVNVVLDEQMLTRPINNQFLLPYATDPTFRSIPAINLLAALSQPKRIIQPSAIRSTPLSTPSKSLFFKTRRGATWLVENVRACLNAYAIEFKITTSTTIVLRLSQTHARIAYYQCFALHFHKISLRSTYGLRLSEVLYTTRTFGRVGVGPQAALLANGEGLPSADAVRAELMERLSSYLTERDENGGLPLPDDGLLLASPLQRGMPELMSSLENGRFELAADPTMPAELMGSFQLPAELEDSGNLFKRRKKPNSPLPEGVIELPG
jgi:hypothetical protein